MGWDKPQPEPFRKGDPLPTAAEHNQIAGLGVRHIGGPGVSNFGNRVSIGEEPPGQGLPDHRFYFDKFVVREIFDNYLKCVPLPLANDPATGWWQAVQYEATKGEDRDEHYSLYVAKPNHVQRTFWDGTSIVIDSVLHQYTYASATTRTVEIGVGEEAETVTETLAQPYFVGDVITAVKGFTGLMDPAGKPIIWQDLNAGGRYWSRPGGGESYVQLYAFVESLVVFSYPSGTGSSFGLDPCARAYARLTTTTDGCNWDLVGDVVLLAPLNPETPFVVGRRYPVWLIGPTLIDITPDTNNTTDGDPYTLYAGDPEFTDDCSIEYTGGIEVLYDVEVECVNGQIQTTKYFKTINVVCGKIRSVT